MDSRIESVFRIIELVVQGVTVRLIRSACPPKDSLGGNIQVKRISQSDSIDCQSWIAHEPESCWMPKIEKCKTKPISHFESTNILIKRALAVITP